MTDFTKHATVNCYEAVDVVMRHPKIGIDLNSNDELDFVSQRIDKPPYESFIEKKPESCIEIDLT